MFVVLMVMLPAASVGAVAQNGPAMLNWSDDFDSYPTDFSLHGTGGWKGWSNNPAATAYTRDEFSVSPPNSVEVTGPTDLVHEYSGYTTGQWVYSLMQYIPTSFVGQTYFILLNQYDDAGANLNWSTEVIFDSALNLVGNDGPAGGTLPMIRGQWVEIRVEIDLDANTQSFYYGGSLLFSDSWTEGMSGGGILDIAAVDLYANGASPVYYDNIALGPPFVGFYTYLPLVFKTYGPPNRPALYPIDNPDGDGNYTVYWTARAGATSYLLQEDDDPAFGSPSTAYNGPNTSLTLINHFAGTFYYRVRASNAWGTSPWSNAQSVTVNPPGWQTLVSTDFEGTFPSPWIVFDDDGSTNGEYYWGKRSCRAFEGSNSGWAVGAGANGGGLPCGSNYPDNALSWMVYGPFSLQGASAGDLGYQLWLNSESGYDYAIHAASINGTDFYGEGISGSIGAWLPRVLDLANVPDLGNLMGQPQVWVAIIFASDGGVTMSEGAYVDNVVLRKYNGLAPAPGRPALPALPPGAQVKVVSLSLER
jgi:hypothetical protein